MIRQWLNSLIFGLVVGIAFYYFMLPSESSALNYKKGDDGEGLNAFTQWAFDNLDGSLPIFVVLCIAFFVSLYRMKQALESEASIERISMLEHWVDMWVNLFVGIGVVWTAIGMRGALISALSGLDAEQAAELGSFEILQRLIEGGILVALSTTIVGALGGYLLKLYKGYQVGALLRDRYSSEAKVRENAVLNRLDKIAENVGLIHGGISKKGLNENSSDAHDDFIESKNSRVKARIEKNKETVRSTDSTKDENQLVRAWRKDAAILFGPLGGASEREEDSNRELADAIQ